MIICIIPHVSASDYADNLTQTDSCEIPEIMNVGDDIQTLEEEMNDYGTFSELGELVYKKYAVDLDKDYLYTDEIDMGYYVNGIDIEHEITINGNGHSIDGNGSRIFNIVKGVKEVKIYNLTFKNTYYPGIIDYYSYNVRDFAGAIDNQGELILENCTFLNNHANKQGGAINNNGDLTIDGCTFINNTVFTGGYAGGAIISYGKLDISNSRFYDSFGRFAGAILVFNQTIIRNSIFENNTSRDRGGAVVSLNLNTCEVFNSIFNGNKAEYGGAMYGTIAINCTFGQDNYASTKQGHNLNDGVIFNCTFDEFSNQNFYNTINAASLAFKPKNLNFEDGGYNKILEFTITANPENKPVKMVMLNIKIIDKQGNINSYSLLSDENGKVNVSLSNFRNGTYTVSVSFSNKMYNDSEENYTLLLGITDSKVSFNTGIAFEYGKSGSLYVTVDGGYVERENIQVIGHPEAKITLENKLITISGLGVGTYTLSVKTTPDEYHLATVGTISINVKKAIAVIKAEKLTVVLKKGSYWTIKLVDYKTNKPISNMKLTVKIFTGKKYKKVTITTNSKGEAKYKTSKLSKGNHKIIVSGTHPGYSFNTLSSSIKVIKPKALKFKLQRRINDKSGSLISYLAIDKKTKKGINGIKINLLIYTGKKVKKITLKTKKIKGKKKTYMGAFGFATNDLSVGKHKVIIKPVSIKYSGSAKTTMIIKKEAKKRQTFSHKI